MLYRYYPLDWFQKNEITDYLEAFKKETLSINPPHTFVIQNKAFYALVFELINGGFFDAEEEYIINKYIPKTALSIEKLNLRDYCIKPFLGREGEGIKFNYEIESLPEDEYIYQEKIYIDSVNLNRHSTMESYEEVKFPVIGAYIVNNKYAGIYTRVGDLVTDRWAVCLPTYIET
jgi:Glutathionylspermidine synthase